MKKFFFDFNLMIFFNFLGLWLDWFHSFNCFLLFFIIFFVLYCFFFIFYFFSFFKMNLGYGLMEFWMCFVPVFFLLAQAFPSLFLIFGLGFSVLNIDLTVKIIGHQWYWSYELGDNLGLFFDSYMLSEDFFFLGDYRLLEVDNRLVLPINFSVRFILTSFDVIHSWTLPFFFLKADVMSGLLSILDSVFELVGIFYGQCSEICGTNHSFMPIVLEISLFDFFKNWVFLL